ncbi:hypothetical protein MNB_SM-7-533 [hydrothermal vent metagenome]|uniref:Uncharacterized protein n=1 Tax=hydrothermal vent metagenome TaxID=652676 RepID=A0A1W1C239_9ZZZZ
MFKTDKNKELKKCIDDIESKSVGAKLTEAFGHMYPVYADKVLITNHAAERILERFGKINSQVGRAICRAVKKANNIKGTRAKGETYKCQAIVSNNSDDDKIAVVTVLFNN